MLVIAIMLRVTLICESGCGWRDACIDDLRFGHPDGSGIVGVSELRPQRQVVVHVVLDPDRADIDIGAQVVAVLEAIEIAAGNIRGPVPNSQGSP